MAIEPDVGGDATRAGLQHDDAACKKKRLVDRMCDQQHAGAGGLPDLQQE